MNPGEQLYSARASRPVEELRRDASPLGVAGGLPQSTVLVLTIYSGAE